MNAMAVLHTSATTSDIPSDAWSLPKEIMDGKGCTAYSIVRLLSSTIFNFNFKDRPEWEVYPDSNFLSVYL